ncbi:MAG: T9SS type A sorting domain-containing protein [Cytophagaceae bacterium]
MRGMLFSVFNFVMLNHKAGKSVKLYLILLGLFIGALSDAHGQETLNLNLSISGGDQHSAMICQTGRVFAWGRNRTGAGGGVVGSLGTGSTEDNILEPEEVLLPVGLEVYQVSAGSGAFTISLACNGEVWMWGGNQHGQIGNGTNTPNVVTVPSPVLRGEGPASADDPTLLGNVIFVEASTSTSYAILDDGRVVAWGSNQFGQLGAGLNTATVPYSATPVYLKTRVAGAIIDLQNVIHVTGGDENIFALVDANGDGTGTVYSAGGNAFNDDEMVIGRPIADQNLMMPVLKENGDPLDNIVFLAAGDVHGLAIDADGYVWAWGNNGWGCATLGAPPQGEITRATRVPAGAYQDVSGNPFLTNVIRVSGGRGFSMAVTADGYALTWGNNDITNGGALGNGDDMASSCATGPVFLEYEDGSVVDNALEIYRGDNWGFLINDQNQFYTWGYNHRGQLGLGDTDTRYRATLLDPQLPCSQPDPCPIARMPSLMEVCPGSTFTLAAGFTPPLGKENLYVYRWYYSTDGTGGWLEITPGTPQPHLSINAEDIGFYRVTIEYVGMDVPCNMCTMSEDVIEIRYVEAPFSDPGDNIFCLQDGVASVYVNGDGEYEWFASMTSTDVLGSSSEDNQGNIDISGSMEIEGTEPNRTMTVYVEDVSSFVETIGPPHPGHGFAGATGHNTSGNDTYLQFQVQQQLTLNSLQVQTIQHGNAVSSEISITTIGGTPVAGSPFFAEGPSGAAGTWVTATAEMDVLLEPGVYIIQVTGGDGIRSFANAGDGFYPQNYMGLIEFLDNHSGFNQHYNPNHYGGFFNWVVSAGTVYPCNRIPVVLEEDCTQPVQLLNFDAEAQDNGILVRWETYEEINNHKFKIQRSTDGVNFETIGTIEGNGTSSGISYYSFLDESPLSGENYYRLVQVDFDGTKSHSHVVKVSRDGIVDIHLFPNPYNDAFYLVLAGLNGEAFVSIKDVTGRTLVEGIRISQDGKTQLGQGFTPGMYFVEIRTPMQTVVKKVIKN